MDNRLIYKGFIQNAGNTNLTITSPDIKELDGKLIPPNVTFPFQVVLPVEYKIYTSNIINKEGELTGVYIAIVDINF